MLAILLLAARELRTRGAFAEQPWLDGLLDLVALGTVPDVVKLDANNRRLVAQGPQAHAKRPRPTRDFSAAGRDASKARA